MISLRSALTMIFAGLVLLKVGGLTDLSWWIVLFPFTAVLIVVALVFAAVAVLVGADGVVRWQQARRRRLLSREVDARIARCEGRPR